MKKIKGSMAAALLAAGILGAMNPAAAMADVYYSGNTGVQKGPGIGLSSGTPAGDDTVSLDAADYAATGGVARGGMSISSAIPAGCVEAASLEPADPVVMSVDNYSYDYMFHDMDVLSQRYAGKMTYRSIGKSRDGRDIYEIIIGNRNAPTQVLFTAAIHAREHITTNLAMKQVEYLLYAWEQNGAFDGRSLNDWFNQVCIHYVPMINPDGVAISQFGIDGLRDPSLQSALRTAYNYDTSNYRTSYDFAEYCRRFKANAIGVDLNQNFDGAWDTSSGSATQGSFSGYKGPYPASEPETAALTSLYNSRDFKAVVNYHAMGNVIYWDIAHNKLREHSRDLANNLSALTGYQMLFSAGGGGFKDYVQLCANPSTSVTLEIGSTAAPVPSSEMPTIWAQNKFVPFYTMKWAQEKGK